MLKRLLCLLTVLVLSLSCALSEDAAPSALRYDLDLTFSLNPEALSPLVQRRARGYAQLLDCLALRGDLTLCEATSSFDLNGVLLFRDKPEVQIPFRFYGIPNMLFLTSPIIGNETLLFNMRALAEFSIKIRKTLDTPLPALALLYLPSYEFNFWNVREAWETWTGPAGESREISAEQITALADAWQELLNTDPNLNVWMNALSAVSSAPEAVEAELQNIPSYLRDFVAAGDSLYVMDEDGREVWENASGITLSSRESSEDTLSWSLTLPADENSYRPAVSLTCSTGENKLDCSLEASLVRDQSSALPDWLLEAGYSPVTGSDEEDESEDAEEEEEEEEDGEKDESEVLEPEDSIWPQTMLHLSASCSSLPLSLPADSSFRLSASAEGALYPNFDLTLLGETKKGGAVSVSLCRPSAGADPVTLFSCQGTVIPGSAETVPDFNYTAEELYGTYNFFSFSEYYVAKFKNAVTRPLLKGLLDFVAEAPVAACQALLDDLTDSGILNMMSSD